MKLSTVGVVCGALLYSGAVAAASVGRTGGPSWEVIAAGAVSLLITFALIWISAVSKKQSDTAAQVTELQKAMLTQYHPKTDIADMIREVRLAVADLRNDNHRWQEKMEQKFTHLESIYGR